MDRQELEEGARNILLTNLRRGVADWNGKEFSFVVPSLRGYPFQWFWDSCFHAIALTHLDLEQAKAELRTLMSGALPNGFIPHITFWEMDKQPDFLSRNIVGMTSPNYSSTMQPPIIAYAVERVYQATGDEAFRDEALPILTAFYRWLRANRDPDDDGLIAVIQPEEAGTDCSPKYDEALGLEELTNQGFITALRKVYAAYEPMRGDDRRILAADIFHFEDVLVNSIYAFGMRSLARLLGDSPEAAEFQREADRTLEALLAKCWDEEAGAFFDLSGVAESPVRVVTISSLMPLILDDLPGPSWSGWWTAGSPLPTTSGCPTLCLRYRPQTPSLCRGTPGGSSGGDPPGLTPTGSFPTVCAGTVTRKWPIPSLPKAWKRLRCPVTESITTHTRRKVWGPGTLGGPPWRWTCKAK